MANEFDLDNEELLKKLGILKNPRPVGGIFDFATLNLEKQAGNQFAPPDITPNSTETESFLTKFLNRSQLEQEPTVKGVSSPVSRELNAEQVPTPAPAPKPGNVLDFGGSALGSQEGLQAAQERQKDLQFLANMNRSAAQFSQGLARTGKLDTSVADAVEKQGQQEVENYQQQVSNQKNDPNSAYSKGLKDYFKTKLGMTIKGNPSGADLEKLMPFAVREFEAEQDRAFRKEEGAKTRGAQKEIAGAKLKAGEEKADKAGKEKVSTRTRMLRGELQRGPAAKTYNNFLNSDRSSKAIEQFMKDPTGYSDYATLLGGLKSLQGDESVVRETEIRLGMDAGSFKDKIMNRIEQLRTGKSLQPGQRDDILQAVNILRDVTKNQFLQVAEPTLAQAESEGVPREHLLSSIFDEAKKETLSKEDKEAVEWAKKNPEDPRAAKILQLHGIQ
jgi:hypothetical protein